MQISSSRLLAGALLMTALVAPLCAARAQGPPLFTHDYYIVEPTRWEDKSVTLSVTHIESGEGVEGGKRRMVAHTFFNGLDGGKIDVVATEPAAVGLLRQCGTQKQPLGKGRYRLTQIHGVFKRGATGKGGRYYLLVEK